MSLLEFIKGSLLPTATVVDDDDWVFVISGGVTSKIRRSVFLAGISGGSKQNLFDILTVGNPTTTPNQNDRPSTQILFDINGEYHLNNGSESSLGFILHTDLISSDGTILVYPESLEVHENFDNSAEYKILNNSNYNVLIAPADLETPVELIGGSAYIPKNSIAIIKFLSELGKASITFQPYKAVEEGFMKQNVDYTLPVSSSTLQKMFNVGANGNAAISLSEGTYEFECVATWQLDGTTLNVRFGFLGNAVISSSKYIAISLRNSSLTIGGSATEFTSTSPSTSIISVNNATLFCQAVITGCFVVGTAGTVIPSTSTSVNAAVTCQAGNLFKWKKIGSKTQNYSENVD